MAASYKTDLRSARAFGSGDWDKVIEIETEALEHETHKQYRYSVIGMAYENQGNLDKAKENYAQAISIDDRCVQALEGLAGIYAKENNHDLAYQYVLRGLHLSDNDDFKVPGVMKYLAAILIKIFRPTRPFSEIYEETQQMDQSRNRWVEWALKYKEWYEKKNGPSSYESIN